MWCSQDWKVGWFWVHILGRLVVGDQCDLCLCLCVSIRTLTLCKSYDRSPRHPPKPQKEFPNPPSQRGHSPGSSSARSPLQNGQSSLPVNTTSSMEEEEGLEEEAAGTGVG